MKCTDWLFANQAGLLADNIVRHSEELSIVGGRLRLCMDGAGGVIERGLAEGKRIGVTGTPTIFIGTVNQDGTLSLRRRMNGAVGVDVVKAGVAEVIGNKVRD